MNNFKKVMNKLWTSHKQVVNKLLTSHEQVPTVVIIRLAVCMVYGGSQLGIGWPGLGLSLVIDMNAKVRVNIYWFKLIEFSDLVLIITSFSINVNFFQYIKQ